MDRKSTEKGFGPVHRARLFSIRGEMASSSSAAGRREVQMAVVKGGSAGSDGWSACQGFHPLDCSAPSIKPAFLWQQLVHCCPQTGVRENNPGRNGKGFNNQVTGGMIAPPLGSPQREEGPEVCTSEREEGPAASPTSVPKHFIVKL